MNKLSYVVAASVVVSSIGGSVVGSSSSLKMKTKTEIRFEIQIFLSHRMGKDQEVDLAEQRNKEANPYNTRKLVNFSANSMRY